MDNLLFILKEEQRLLMLCEYAHVKLFALSNSLTCHSMMFFNPFTYSLNPVTKLLNPLTRISAPEQMLTDTLAKNEFLIKRLTCCS